MIIGGRFSSSHPEQINISSDCVCWISRLLGCAAPRIAASRLSDLALANGSGLGCSLISRDFLFRFGENANSSWNGLLDKGAEGGLERCRRPRWIRRLPSSGKDKILSANVPLVQCEARDAAFKRCRLRQILIIKARNQFDSRTSNWLIFLLLQASLKSFNVHNLSKGGWRREDDPQSLNSVQEASITFWQEAIGWIGESEEINSHE
jgi:hypothetical protein